MKTHLLLLGIAPILLCLANLKAETPTGQESIHLKHRTASPDGRLFAGYYRDGWDEVISIHEAGSGKQVVRIVGHGDDVREFKFSPDGKFLASRCVNRSRRGWALWNVATGELVMRLPTPVVIGQEVAKAPLAHFRFNGSFEDASGNDNKVVRKNARFKDGALYASGKYDVSDRVDALTCKINIPALNFNAFTLGIRIKPYRIREYSYRNIITAGPDSRWFSLRVTDSGKLLVKLNNHEFERPLPFEVVRNRWTTIICGVDVKEKVVRTYVDGKELPTINLPKGFEFDVSSKRKDAEKTWTFANYANASTFHGLVDELVIFDGMLTSEEMARLKLPLQQVSDAPEQVVNHE